MGHNRVIVHHLSVSYGLLQGEIDYSPAVLSSVKRIKPLVDLSQLVLAGDQTIYVDPSL